MGAAFAAVDCSCQWAPDQLRLWCAGCGGLLRDDVAADAAADSSSDAIDLYQAVLADLDRLSGRAGADVKRLAAIRSFYEGELAKQIEVSLEAEHVGTVAAMLAVARELIRNHADGLEAARDAIATSQRELPDEPVLLAAAAELAQRTLPAPPPAIPPVAAVPATDPPPSPTRIPPLPALLPEDEVPPPAHRIIEAASQWAQAFKPFLLGNVGWFVGAFLILAGFAVLVTTYWRNIDNSEILKYSLLFLALMATSGGFLAAAYAIRIRQPDLETASDVLLVMVALLMPLVFAAAVLTTMAEGLLGPILGTAWGGLAFWGVTIGSRLALGPFARQVSPEFARRLAMICAVTLAAPLLRGFAPLPVIGTLTVTMLDYTVAGVAAWTLWQFGDRLLDEIFVDRRLSAYLVLASVGNAALVTLACLHFAVTGSAQSQVVLPASHYAPFLMLLAALVCFVDQRLARAARRGRLVGRLTFTAYALSLVAVGLSLTPYLSADRTPVLQSLAAAQTLLVAAVLYAALAYALRSIVPLYLALFAVVAEYHVVIVQWVVRSAIGIDGWALACLPLLAFFWYVHAELQRRVAQRVATTDDADAVLQHALPTAVAGMLIGLASVLAMLVVAARCQPGAYHARWTLLTCLAFAGWMWLESRRDDSAIPRRAVFALLAAAALIGISPALGPASAASLSALAVLALAGVWRRPEIADEQRDIAFTAACSGAALALPALLIATLAPTDALLARATLIVSSLVLVVSAGLTGSRLPLHLAALACAAVAPAAIPYAAVVAAVVGGDWWGSGRRLDWVAKRFSPTKSGTTWFGVAALPFAQHGGEIYRRALREIGLGAALFAVVAGAAGAFTSPAAMTPVIVLASAAVALALSSRAYPVSGLCDVAFAVALFAIHAGADRLFFAPLPADSHWQAHVPLAAAIALAAWYGAALLRRRAPDDALWAPALHRDALALATLVLSVLYIETVLLDRGWLQLAAIAMVGAVFLSAVDRRETAYLALSAGVLAALNALSLAGWRTPLNETTALSALAVACAVVAAGCGSPLRDTEQRTPRADRWSLPLILAALALAGVAVTYGVLLAATEQAMLIALAGAAVVAVFSAVLLRVPELLYVCATALWAGIYAAFALLGIPLVDAGALLLAVATVFWMVGEGLRSGSGVFRWLAPADVAADAFALPPLCVAQVMTVAAIAHAMMAWLPLNWDGPQVALLATWSGATVLLVLVARSVATLPAAPMAPGLGSLVSVLGLSTLAVAIAGALGPVPWLSRLVASAVPVALFAAIAARVVQWQSVRVAAATRVGAGIWRESLAMWSRAALVVCAFAFVAQVLAHEGRGITMAPAALVAGMMTLTLLQLSALTRAMLPIAIAASVVTCLFASAAVDWAIPPDLALAACGIVCLLPEYAPTRGRGATAVRIVAGAFGDVEVRPLLDIGAGLLLGAAALAAIPLQIALAPGWPSAGATLGAVALALAVSGARRGDERRASAAALLGPIAAWCVAAAIAGVGLVHPALPALGLAVGLVYVVVPRTPLLAGAPLLRAVLPQLGLLLIVAANLGAILMIEERSWWLAAAGLIAAVAWADAAWNPPLPRLADDRLRDGMVYLAELLLVATYLYVRHGILGRPFGPNMVTAGSVIAASIGLLAVNAAAVRARSGGAAPFARVAYQTALILPLALLFVTPRTREAATMSALVAGAFYMLIAQRTRALWALYAAAALWNVALYVWMPVAHAHTGLMQLYVVPAAITVLGLAQLHRRHLSPPALARIRLCATGTMLAAATTEVVFGPTLAHFALVLGLSLLGIAGGIALRIRVVVFVGVAFLVLNVLLQLGLHLRTPAGVTRGLLLITVGMLITGGMILLNLKRSQLLRRYHAFVTDPSWE